ncbi:MAG: hypothetical protein Q9220_007012 [cf. Caloplaca sp. 1 TL-2023]
MPAPDLPFHNGQESSLQRLYRVHYRLLTSSLNNVKELVSRSIDQVRRLVERYNFEARHFFACLYVALLRAVGPDNIRTMPRRETAVGSLLGFFAFLIMTSLAVKYPTENVRTAFTVASSFLILALSLCIWKDFAQRHGEYRRNLGNSLLTTLFTMILLTIVYSRVCLLLGSNVQAQTKRLDQKYPIFPAVALMQQVQTSSQAKLINTPLKCWAGDYGENGPQCHDLSTQEYLSSDSCNCNGSWSPTITENFVPRGPGGGTWRYLQFTPSENLVSKHPGFLLTAQAWFTFNGTKARDALWVMPSPDLWLAIFDSSLRIEDALANGYAPLSLINANGVISIDLKLNTVRSKYLDPMYFYSKHLTN